MLVSLRLLYDLAAQHDGVFSIEEARSCGLTPDQIRDRATTEWRRLYDGVYLAPGAPLTWRGRVRAVCLAGAPHAAVSHRSAATFYDVVGGSRQKIEVACPRWLRTKEQGLIVHERSLILPSDTQLIDGIPVTRPELVVLQLASIYRSPDFIERVMQSMRRQRLITLASTDDMLRRHARKGVSGVRVTRAALARWDPNLLPTDSDMEIRLLQILRGQGIHGLVPQYEVFAADGRFIARVDLAAPEYRLGIEYDSTEWHGDEISIDRDNSRRNDAFAAHWTILTARRRDVRNGGHEIARAIRAHIHSCAA